MKKALFNLFQSEKDRYEERLSAVKEGIEKPMKLPCCTNFSRFRINMVGKRIQHL
jgi:hypothetical protein